MPRMDGVSGSSTVWRILRNPSPRTHIRCPCWVPIGLLTSVTLRVLPPKFAFAWVIRPAFGTLATPVPASPSGALSGGRIGFPPASPWGSCPRSSPSPWSCRRDFLDRLAALGGNLGRGVHPDEPVDGGAHHVVGIGRP